MAEVTISGSNLPTPLQAIMAAENVQPGTAPSYELCKMLYEFHPLAGKIIEKPVTLALSKPRKINVPGPLEEELVKAFETEWDSLKATDHVRDLMHLSRVYGVASLVYGSPQTPTDKQIDPWKLSELPEIYFNVFDPLNLAGSVVTNQNPNAPDFLKSWQDITAAGQPYHRSRTYTVFTGTPIYLSYQGSAFSFAGRSLFLRGLYPLKSFIQTMTVDDLVSLKAGLIIAKLKPAGSIVNKLMSAAAGFKRAILQEAVTGNVLSIDIEESIESIDLNNTDKAMTVARNNIIANVAASTDVPAILLKDEAFTQGFGEGTEDSKAVVQYIEGIRRSMAGPIAFMDKIVQHRAWSEEFYEGLKRQNPDVVKVDYKTFFYTAQNLFAAEWPSLLEEPKSEEVERESKKLDAATKALTAMAAVLDPANKARAVTWFTEVLNDMPVLFSGNIEIDQDELANYEPPAPEIPGQGGPPGAGGKPPQLKADGARADADFRESDHPRDNSGKFTSGGGGGTGGVKERDPIVLKKALGEKLNTSLRGADKAIETRLANKITRNFDQAVKEYDQLGDSEGGKVLSTDVARELSPDYMRDRSKSNPVHEPASYFITKLWAERLAEPIPPGTEPYVLFTGGGAGSGETSGLAQVNAEVSEKASLIYDTNMGDARKAIKKIDEALAAKEPPGGREVKIAYVYRDVTDALVNGGLSRAMSQFKKHGSGRTVPLEVFVRTHVDSNNAIRDVAHHYADDSRVDIGLIDNSKGRGNAAPMELDDLPKLEYADEYAKAKSALDEAFRDGRINEYVYRGFGGDPATLEQRKARA